MAAQSPHADAAGGTFDAAHRALLTDGSLQFDLPPAIPPAPPPEWLTHLLRWLGQALRPVARLLRRLGHFLPDAPYARILLWGVIAALAVLVVRMVADRIRHGEWRSPRRRRRAPAPTGAEVEWAPAAAPVRAWLAEADALAADGAYAEAVHHLLFRSVEDMARRRPGTVRPALTSRELAAAALLPARVRIAFGGIAALVERSLFGGAPLATGDWQAARAAYSDLALPRAWADAAPPGAPA